MRYFYRNISLVLALILLVPRISVSEQAGEDRTQAEIIAEKKLDKFLSLGWKYRSLKPDSSIAYLNRAVDFSVYLHSTSKIAKTYNYLGVVYKNLGKLDSAYMYFKKALDFANLANDSTQIAYALNNSGDYFLLRAQFFLALEHIFRADIIFKRMNNLRGRGYTQQHLGLVYLKLGEYEKAEEFFEESLKLRAVIADSDAVATSKRFIALSKLVRGNLDEAEKMINEYLDFYKKEKMYKSYSLSYKYLAEIEFLRKNYEQALSLLQKSLKISEKITCYLCETESNILYAKIYFKLKNYDLAFQHLDKAVSYSKNAYFGSYILALKTYIDFYSRLAIPEKIEEYTKKLVALKNSLYEEEAKIRDMEFKKLLLVNKLRKTNDVLSGEIKAKEKVVLLSVIFGIVSMFFLIIVIFLNRKVNIRTKELTKALNDKNKLFSIIAHDLKNPFHSLLGYADLLLNDLEDEDEVDTEELKIGIKQMRVSSQKLLDMVENLLQWARSQTGQIKYEPDVYNINDIILETVSYLVQSAKAKGVDLKVSLTPDYKCFCDQQMISTALRNLIINSIKFCYSGDYIKISAKKDKQNKKLIVFVEDTGVGVAKEKLENLFKDNFTEKGTGGESGTGLGLTLVKEMITKNKGEIFVDSIEGKGTLFWFTIPLAE